jgi:hypothetical protein
MRLALTPHPDTPCTAISGIEVDLAWSGALRLRFRATGDGRRLVLAPPAAPERKDELWRTTCFEAFAKPEGGEEGYIEFNFAPSGAWAAYRFSRYREEMASFEIAPPKIELTAGEAALELSAALEIALSGPLRLALCAVIEEQGGRKSYWALAHPPGRPDFHHPAGFACQIAPESR